MNRLPRLVAGALPLLSAAAALRATPADLPHYAPDHQVTGLIRSWGSENMAGVLKRWEIGFAKQQPEVQFFDTLKGTQTAQAALYTDVADLALMERAILPLELYPLFRRKHYFPLELSVATGSDSAPGRAFALAVFVNRDNPLAKLTLAQLDGIFGAQRNGSIDKKLVWHESKDHTERDNLRTWGQLGLTGEWAAQPIHVYGYPGTIWAENESCMGAAAFFREVVLHGGDKWNPDLVESDDGAKIAAAVAADRFAIGYTALGYKSASLKTVAIATAPGADYVEPNRTSVADRTYPLARSIYIYIDRNPNAPTDPKVREFLKYILSSEGQEAVAEDGTYLPLTVKSAAAQLKKLN